MTNNFSITWPVGGRGFHQAKRMPVENQPSIGPFYISLLMDLVWVYLGHTEQ